MSSFVYIIRCSDNSLYTGMAADWKERIRRHYFHLSGCAKYTRSRQVVSVEAVFQAPEATAARRLEAKIKRLEREQKLLLIANPEALAEFFPELAEEYEYIRLPASLEDCIKVPCSN